MVLNATKLDGLCCEYEAILADAAPHDGNRPVDWKRVETTLATDADWTPAAAEELTALARNYGTFILRNALALAAVLDVEDGELGL